MRMDPHRPQNQSPVLLTVPWVKGRVLIEGSLSPELRDRLIKAAHLCLSGVRDLDPLLAAAPDAPALLRQLGLQAPIAYISPRLLPLIASIGALQDQAKRVQGTPQGKEVLAALQEAQRVTTIFTKSVSAPELGLIRGITLDAGNLTILYAPTTPKCSHRAALARAIGEAVVELFREASKFIPTLRDPGIQELEGQVWKREDVDPAIRAHTGGIDRAHKMIPLTVHGNAHR